MSAATETQVPATGPADTTDKDRPKGLARKLVAAALAVEAVDKRGRNDQQKYDYVRAEDVAAAATKVLLSFGVLSEFEVTRSEQTAIKSNRGTDGLIVTVYGRLVVTDSESGESISRPAMGSGSDYPGDKAIYKAMTGARKYAYLHLLGIPIGDDPDAESRAPNGQAPAPTKRPATPQLSREKVAQVKNAIKEAGLKFSQVDLLLGSIGADALRAKSVKALDERVRSLASEQADQLLVLIQREADRDGE